MDPRLLFTPNRSVGHTISDHIGANQWYRTCVSGNDNHSLLITSIESQLAIQFFLYRLPLCPVQVRAVSQVNIVAKSNKFLFPMILVWDRKWVNFARYSMDDHLIGWWVGRWTHFVSGRQTVGRPREHPRSIGRGPFTPFREGRTSVASVRLEADWTSDGVKKRQHLCKRFIFLHSLSELSSPRNKYYIIYYVILYYIFLTSIVFFLFRSCTLSYLIYHMNTGDTTLSYRFFVTTLSTTASSSVSVTRAGCKRLTFWLVVPNRADFLVRCAWPRWLSGSLCPAALTFWFVVPGRADFLVRCARPRWLSGSLCPAALILKFPWFRWIARPDAAMLRFRPSYTLKNSGIAVRNVMVGGVNLFIGVISLCTIGNLGRQLLTKLDSTESSNRKPGSKDRPYSGWFLLFLCGCKVAKTFYCFYVSLHVATCQTQGDGISWRLVYFGRLQEPLLDCHQSQMGWLI